MLNTDYYRLLYHHTTTAYLFGLKFRTTLSSSPPSSSSLDSIPTCVQSYFPTAPKFNGFCFNHRMPDLPRPADVLPTNEQLSSNQMNWELFKSILRRTNQRPMTAILFSSVGSSLVWLGRGDSTGYRPARVPSCNNES